MSQRTTYVIRADLTTFGEFKDRRVEGSEVVGVTSDPDEAEVLARRECVQYANLASSSWRRTSARRWVAAEPETFRYVVTIEAVKEEDE